MSNEIESLRSVLTTFKARRQYHEREIAKLDPVISAIEDELAQAAPAAPSERKRQGAPAGGIYKGVPVGLAAVHFLKLMGTDQSTKAIVQALVDGGQSAKTNNRYRLVYNILAARTKRQNPDVEKTDGGWKYKPPETGAAE